MAQTLKMAKQNKGKTRIHFQQYYFAYLKIRKPNMLKTSKRRAPKNDEDPSHKVLKIPDMKYIHIKNEMILL